MDRGLSRFSSKLRIPVRHKKRQPVATTPDMSTEPPPSYNECSMFFYAPPSYEEIVADSPRAQRRHSMNRMSWGSDTSSSSSIDSAASSSSSLSSTSSPLLPSAPPLSPVSTSYTESSPLSLWLSSVSSTSPRSDGNRSRLTRGYASSDSLNSNSSSSSCDVITRVQPRLRSWTQCIRWVIQYTLEGNFRSTVAHFQCLVNAGLRVSREHEADTEICPIRLSSLAVSRPTALSLKTWMEFILCMGFKFSQSNVDSSSPSNSFYNDNYSNTDSYTYDNIDNNYEDAERHNSFYANILENLNNNSSSDDVERLCVIVPRGLAQRRLMKYKDVLRGLLELPYSAIKTAANMSRTEAERVIALLTSLIQSSSPVLSRDHTLSADHALVRSVWDVHRRPGFFLQSLDFIEFRHQGGKFLKVPAGEIARRRFHLAKEILEMLQRS